MLVFRYYNRLVNIRRETARADKAEQKNKKLQAEIESLKAELVKQL